MARTSSFSWADGSLSDFYTASPDLPRRIASSSRALCFFLPGKDGSTGRPKIWTFSGFGSSDVLDVADRIREICAVPVDDGIVFDLAGVEAERIKEDGEYEAVRVRVPASLDGARVSIQIDVGFGDVVEPPPADLTFPVLLPLDAPVLRAYPPEVVIAERFQAMVALGIANSRMKDFFDVWTLAQTRGFDFELIAGSIRGTFERRRTPLPESVPMALTGEFLEDPSKQTQWASFGRRLGLRDVPPLPLVGRQIAQFLMPVLFAAREADPASRTWAPGGPWVERATTTD